MDPKPRRKKWKRWALLCLVAAPALLALWAFGIEPYWIEVTRHETGSGPRELVVLHLTDIHVSTPGRRERRVLEIAEAEKPDLIVITGDSVLHGYDRAGFGDFMSKLRAPMGVFACPGNWEDWVGRSVDEDYEKAGVRMLRDASVGLPGVPAELLGLSSAHAPVPDGSGRFRIALCHYPASLSAAARKGVDLVLAGHSHGGQVRLPFAGALALPFDCDGREAGWYEEGKTRLYVSRGVGTSILPVRFLCRPEVAVHRVRFEPGP